MSSNKATEQHGENKMKTLKTKHGIKIDVRSIEDFDDNAKILEFGSDHYSSGEYVEGFQVDMDIDATLADGASKSFKVSFQSVDRSDKLRAHVPSEMQFAQHYGADWDESRELVEFIGYKDWVDILEFLVGLAEDLCKKWYSANKGEATND